VDRATTTFLRREAKLWRVLARWLGLRSEDRRDTTVAFLTLLGIMTAHALLETARDALYLSRLPAATLPWAYIAIAGLSVGGAALSRRVRGAVPRRLTLTLWLLLGSAITASFRFLVGSQSSAALLGFYVWTGVFATIIVVEFWLLSADVLDFGQAKRVFGVIGAGGLAGAVLGAALASALLVVVTPPSLVLVSAAILALSAVAPLFFSRARSGPARRTERHAPWRASLGTDPYLRRLLWVALSSSTVLTGVDFVFKATASVDLAPDQLAPFFARFYAVIGGVALFVQLLVAPRALRALGVDGSLLLMPALLLLGSGGFVVTGGLGAALLMRGADGALRHSLHRTSTEILYVPLSPSVRDRYKGFVEAIGQRGGQAAASVMLLGATAIGAGPDEIGIALVGLAALWLGASVGIRPHYVELFRRNLREGGLETPAGVPDLDLHSLETLMSALSSHNDHEVTAALDLLASYGKTHLAPALVLYHPSPDVVLRAFALFSAAGRSDVARFAERLIAHDDERVRAAALRYSASHASPALLESMTEDPSPLVRTTAVVELIRRGSLDADRSRAVLESIVEHGSPALRHALAVAARDLPAGRYSWVLVTLSLQEDPDLEVEVARSMAAAPDMAYAPTLVRLLSVRACREQARSAILALGEAALGALESALADPALPREVRRHLPRTIARLGGKASARALERHLYLELDEAIEMKILRALARMRIEDPAMAVERGMLLSRARSTLERAVTLLFWQVSIESLWRELPRARSAAAEMLLALLADKEATALERVFRVLKVLDPSEEFEVLLAGLRSSDPALRENGRELLMHVVPEPLRTGILAMLGDGAPLARLRGAARFHDPEGRVALERALASPALDAHAPGATGPSPLEALHVDCLRDMLVDPSEAVRALAHYRIAELGIARPDGAPGPSGGAFAELSNLARPLTGIDAEERAVVG